MHRSATGISEVTLIKQHLIDPEVCIRCNTCEETCPVDAITHDDRNYVVNAEVCNACGACLSPCPTGSIDHWRIVERAKVFTLQEQLGWDELPTTEQAGATTADDSLATLVGGDEAPTQVNAAVSPSSTKPPHSAAVPQTHLHGVKNPISATVAGNLRLTGEHASGDVRHIVLDFGSLPFPVLEGQSIGIIPPGADAHGRPHHPRMYSVASPRTGEREGYNNLSLTVKRVVESDAVEPIPGVCSSFVCDLQKGDTVQVTGPFGASFLMPNHAGSNILMVCTGTGSAPMRAMTEHRRRLRAAGQAVPGRLMLFFGARRPEELPYFGPLTKLPAEFINTQLAFSRVPGQPRQYVQDRMRERAADVAELLRGDSCVYLCGLKGMETGVLEALRDAGAGIDWPALHQRLVDEGRFHVETY
ncbi:MAG: benzoyl-CoA 2,3-epoxidase subunit BoxA [Burkholderiales bacterium]